MKGLEKGAGENGFSYAKIRGRNEKCLFLTCVRLQRSELKMN